MGSDSMRSETIEQTVKKLTANSKAHHLVDYNGDNVHKNDGDLMPQGCRECPPSGRSGLGQQTGKVEPHKHYHLWTIEEGDKGDKGEWIRLVLISQFDGDAVYREYSEQGGPFYYTCPEKWLERVPEPEGLLGSLGNADGWTWRMHVRRYAKLTKRREYRRAKRAAAEG